MATIVGSDNTYQGGISFTTMGSGSGGFQFDLPLATVAAFQQKALDFSAGAAASNKLFLNKSLTRTGAAVSNDTAGTLDFINRGVAGVGASVESAQHRAVYASDLAQQYSVLRQQTQPKAPKPGKSCFITTAVCESEGLPDDCETLTILRKFRDEFMLTDSERAKFVEEYYDNAPSIVDALDSLPDEGAHAYRVLRGDIDVAVTRIRNGDFEGAFHSYRAVYQRAAMLAHGV